jgi:signal transduction histidine kinase
MMSAMRRCHAIPLRLLFPLLAVVGLLIPMRHAGAQSNSERMELSATQLPRRGSARLMLDAAMPVYAGQFPAGTNLVQIKFKRPVKGRYFGLDASSAWDGRAFAAVAEVNLLDESGQLLDRTNWKVVYADSEELDRENGAAMNAIDGAPGTHWHTQWSAEARRFPHRLILDLGASQFVSGFSYLPRQGGPAVGGRIKDFSVGIGDRLKAESPLVNLLPERCYLFAYFTDNDRDGLHLAWSMDGFAWDVINGGQSVLKPGFSSTNLLRDPFLARGPDGIYHLVWTMHWTQRSIGYASSPDLIHWSAPRALPVMAQEPAALNCWAPEFYWNAARQEYLIFWSSAVTNRFQETLGRAGQMANQRLYCTTTRDFLNFTTTRLYFDPGFGVIDPTLVAAGDKYHLIFKDETDQSGHKNLRYAIADSPYGPFGDVSAPFSPAPVEGPNVFRTSSQYVIYFRHYNNGRWSVMKSPDLLRWENVTERLALPGNAGVHQGTVLEVPPDAILNLWRQGWLELGPTLAAQELGLGNWIWTTNVVDKQTCRLWRSVQVPADTLVSRALLRITADNGYRLFLDGREIGRGGDYYSLTEFDLTPLMSSGAHILAVEAFNDAANAGVILGLQVDLSNGQKLAVASDSSWLVVPRDVPNWEHRKEPEANWLPARVVGFAGRQSWVLPERIIPAPPLQPVVTRFWQQGWFLAGLVLVCVVVAGLSIRQALQLTVQARSNRLLERERARIARDIHDDLGAGLTQLTLEGELILRETARETKTHRQVDALCTRGRSLLGSLDEVVWAVNPRRDTVQDFTTFVCEHAQGFLGSTSLRCRLDVPEVLPPIPLDLPARRNLLLAVKEAVRNAARHSQGDEVSLSVRVAADQLVVVVADNGRGLKLGDASARNGLRNMQERLADVGGVCHFATPPDGGTRITFTVPLATPKLEENRLVKIVRSFLGKPKSSQNIIS